MVTKTTTSTTIDLANVAMSLGNPDRPVVLVSNGAGHFVITASGVAATMTVDVALDIPGVTVAGTFGVALNTVVMTTSHRHQGQRHRRHAHHRRPELTGSFTVEKSAAKDVALALDTVVVLARTDSYVTADLAVVFHLEEVAGDFTAGLTLGSTVRRQDQLCNLTAHVVINNGIAPVSKSGDVHRQGRQRKNLRHHDLRHQRTSRPVLPGPATPP